jgi:hypothetical protein
MAREEGHELDQRQVMKQYLILKIFFGKLFRNLLGKPTIILCSTDERNK